MDTNTTISRNEEQFAIWEIEAKYQREDSDVDIFLTSEYAEDSIIEIPADVWGSWE